MIKAIEQTKVETAIKEKIRQRLSHEWEGDGEAYLYYEACAWNRHNFELCDDHWAALVSYPRKRLNLPKQTTEIGAPF